jgi:hypothetical protein
VIECSRRDTFWVAVSRPPLARELQEFAEGQPLPAWKTATEVTASIGV